MPIQQMLLGAGAKPIEKRYIDQMFSTSLYKGTDGANTVNNGIDISGEGGLVWVKSRTSSRNSMLFDTVRGANYEIATQSTSASNNNSSLNQTFTSTGFTFNNSHSDVNSSSDDYASYTFRKAPGFFDIVTWTGNNDTNRAISHSLGSTPGMIWVKNISTSFEWNVWHRSIWDTSGYKSLRLNTNDSESGRNAFWGVSAPTSSNFYVRSNGANVSGQSYIAYVFAHDDQSFGGAADASVIKCGIFTGNGSTDGPEINLGWEPQWVLMKHSSGNSDWKLFDSMRGVVTGYADHGTQPNKSDQDFTSSNRIDFNPTGFKIPTSSQAYNGNGSEYIYCAIRRPDGYVGKPADAGTDVFAIDTGNASSTIPTFDSGFIVDYAFVRPINIDTNWGSYSRLTGDKFLRLNTSDDQGTYAGGKWDSNVGALAESYWDSNSVAWMWKRHAGMDVVTYEGNGVQGRDIPHSLGVAPNMMWVKNRTRTTGGGAYWNVYVSGITHLSVYGSDPDNLGNNPVSLKLNDTDAAQFSGSGNWDHTHPTSTHFTVGDTYTTNQNGESMIAMLFSSISGISKVGSFTGTGATQTITLGFQPRFLILKMANSSSGAQWYVLDTTRGWGSGDDNFLELNTDDAQTGYNFGAPTSTGFTLTATAQGINASGDEMIYYAHS